MLSAHVRFYMIPCKLIFAFLQVLRTVLSNANAYVNFLGSI